MNPTALLLLLPLGLVVALASSKPKRTKKPTQPTPEPPLPPEVPGVRPKYPMMSPDCSYWVAAPHPDVIDYAEYDRFITKRFIEMRQQGVTDFVEITASIAREHNPQCQWPPGPNAPVEQRVFFDQLLEGVQWYNANCYMLPADERHPYCTWGEDPQDNGNGGVVEGAVDYWSEVFGD